MRNTSSKIDQRNGAVRHEIITGDQQALAEMCRRHADINGQLIADRLVVHDVPGDGNCLYRAASYAAFGDDQRHASLRATVTDYVAQHKSLFCRLFNLNDTDFGVVMADLKSLGHSVGEHAILALSHVMRREVFIYNAFSKPLVYSPATDNATEPGIRLAFYDGINGGVGHYKAILTQHLN